MFERNLKDVLLIAPVSKTAAATASATIDCKGADYATIRVALSTGVNTNAVGPTLSLLDCDTSNGTFATVTADRTAEDNSPAKVVTYGIDLKAKKRYLKLSVTSATATNDTVVVSAVATLSRKDVGPTGTTGAGDVVVYA